MQVIAEPVTITGLSHDGRGVARIDGKAQFVAGALPGEQVRLRRLRRHRNYDDAAVAEILSASPDRVTPRCPHFGVCGACVLQHLEPARQIEAKQRELLAELEHLGKVTPQAVFDPLTGPLWEYRRRARLGVRFVRAMDRAIVGFRERERPYLADLTQCHVLAKPVGELLGPLGALVTELTIRERLPQIEVAVSADVVALVLRVLDPPTAADRERLEAFAAQQGVTFYLQPGDASTVVPLTGPAPRLWFALADFGLELEFAPLDFIQVNGPLNERMVKRALELLAPQPGERILDLFCGLGNFTLPLARQGTQVTGVEGDAGLVARARANAVANGLADTSSFAVADLSADCSGLPWAKQRYDRVLLDPPRAGAREILPVIDACGAHRVVYISCHPGSLARDAGVLVHELGFELKGAGVMDMFPHTSHVESVAVFERAPRGTGLR